MEDKEKSNPILNRILDEIKSAQRSESATTAHNVYTSGIFEDVVKDSDAKPD
jgi:hypothetical protein